VLRLILLALGLLLAVRPAAAQTALRVLNAGPTGEIADLVQSHEVRVVFSEPMVALGRIPEPVTAPFFSIAPSLPGTFRWSGTTILIFTPDRAEPLPFATRFTVTIDRSAQALSGRTLVEPYSFSFTTPTVRLLSTIDYRRNGRFDQPAVMLLRFNQPVRPADVLAAIDARYEPHEWEAPEMTPAMRSRLTPSALQQFEAKLAAANRAASASDRVEVRITNDWDRERFPESPDLVALETVEVPPPGSWIRLTLTTDLASPGGAAQPDLDQSYTVRLEPPLFVGGPTCAVACNPSYYNGLRFTTSLLVDRVRDAVRVLDVTDPQSEVVVQPGAEPSQREQWQFGSPIFALEDLRFDRQPPVTTYALIVDQSLESEDGQTLGYPWVGTIENWHERAVTSFGDGHGVWESSGGPTLPFFARNIRNVTEWNVPIAPPDLMPRILELTEQNFRDAPSTPGRPRTLSPQPDAMQSYGLNLSSSLNAAGTGLVWAAVQEGVAIDRARFSEAGPQRRSSIVQVTNLGITVKDSPDNTLIFVTALDTGEPVTGARVAIIRRDNSTFWQGTTDADGIAIAPETRLRDPNRSWELAFIVTAEKDGDIAYVGSDWNEGISSWEFGIPSDLYESPAVLRGSVFTDRGVYRLGEEVHVKAILRQDTSRGMALLPASSPIYVTLRDAQARILERRTVTASEWSSTEWTFTLPGDGALGNYQVEAALDAPEEPGSTPVPPPDEYDRERRRQARLVTGSFLVAAYRRPDFRVDVAAPTRSTGAPLLAGESVSGAVSARYLFGAAMMNRPVRWTVTRTPEMSVTPAISERFLDNQWVFLGFNPEPRFAPSVVASDNGTLDAEGELVVSVDTPADLGVPYRYTVEGEVEDVSRQRIANRTSQVVQAAPWVVGLRRPPYFAEQDRGLETAVIAVDHQGNRVAGVPIVVTLTQIQWNSVRRAEGNGFYTWETESRDIEVGTWNVTSSREDVPLSIALPSGGSFRLSARAEDPDGRSTTTQTSFYALGSGYTAWARFDHNRIDLVPERASYRPGDEARIMIQSPWEQATALVTTEREGIRSHRRFALTSTQQTISVPITDADIPNVFVSVLLIKGRTRLDAPDDGSDPGKPSFRMGYVELEVVDASKRLTTTVTANRSEYRPATEARVNVTLADAEGRPVEGEVTLWAVDYGVLSLTNFQTPDVLRSVYVPKTLQVTNSDSRQRIVARRAIVPKGGEEGGGGGADPGAGTMRRDFRVLAFWIGSTVTDRTGRASIEVDLPESLTTYRIMAVSADKASRFGADESEIRVNKPVTLNPAFPRFLAVGDTATFGSVVTNQLTDAGSAIVTMRSLDPEILRLEGPDRQTVQVAAGGSAEVRFAVAARAVGRARIQTTVRLNGESDAYEDVLPVEILVSPETVAAYGETQASASETIVAPAGIVPGFGGLSLELSSTAMVGLGEGARYLVEYPYGCAEQRGSRALALLLAADLGDAFALPGIEATELRPLVQSTLRELRTYQCPNGGFSFWPGACGTSSPYLTSYLLHVFEVARSLSYNVDPGMLARGYEFLEEELGQTPPTNEGWWPAYTAWQAFAVKVLVEGGRRQDSHVTRLYGYRDRMPVFALAHLFDAMSIAGENSPRRTDLLRRIENALMPEAGRAHVEELSDPYLLWFWNSNVRSTAMALDVLVRHGELDLARVRPIVRWLMESRSNGRWGNTQENAWAMEALVRYYRRYEGEVPDFTAVVTMGRDDLLRDRFEGRSTEASSSEIPMARLAGSLSAGVETPLTFEKRGTGTLFYSARLRYAVDRERHESLDQGFSITRSYAPFVEGADLPEATSYEAGDLVRVTLTLRLTRERRYVALADPLPAGFEAVESWFATTARDLAAAQDQQRSPGRPRDWMWWAGSDGFDRVERHDDQVRLFATRLSEGEHIFTYIVRATTAGTFRTAPTHVEEMYAPEAFGRTESTVIEVRP